MICSSVNRVVFISAILQNLRTYCHYLGTAGRGQVRSLATLLKSLSIAACAMRCCALPTNFITSFQSMECQSLGLFEDAASLLLVLPPASSMFSILFSDVENPDGVSPRGVLTPRVVFKVTAALRRCTYSKSACFHSGTNLESLCHPLQVTIRFLLIPLPATPWPSLTIRLPTTL
jgi:hypothetical protein